MKLETTLFFAIPAAGLTVAVGCGGTDGRSGLEEPFIAHDAQFVRGELPGDPPVAFGEVPEPPRVTGATASVAYLRERLGGFSFSGQSSDDAVSVGIRIDGRGEGYWLRPTLFPDAQKPGELIWQFAVEFQDSLPAGRHRFLTVAFDKDGNAGTQASTTICVNSLVPDNGNACNPEREPPFVVVSLEWDTPVDLDLKLRLPDGQIIDSDNPVSGEPDDSGNFDFSQSGVGELRHDSNRDCVGDGRQREDIVFQSKPPSGQYVVYASLNRACGEASVTYKSTYHTRVREGDKYSVESGVLGSGSLVSEQAGVFAGTFIGEVTVN